ncbi:MAG: glucose/mannose-6-phosphate isomerase [Candidatus Krumholzibacteriia bacterium]|jgi:glucose/mannose-6-phosphate isomerase
MVEWPAAGLGQMYQLIDNLPEQLMASGQLAGLETVKPAKATVKRIVLCGMGGSAIAGDLVQPLIQRGNISLTVWRDYSLPHWVCSDDLILCCSYSGNTEESLSAARLAGERGCDRVAITSGGQLAELAASDHFPCITLPGGLPPRASLGYGLGALLRVLTRLGVSPEAESEIVPIVEHLRAHNALRQKPMRDDDPPQDDGEGNISPGLLAVALTGRVPVLYTAGHETHAVGVRWKAQLNENSKVPTCVAAFPELDHNDLVGWCLDKPLREKFVLIFLRGKDDNERVARRVEITRELLENEFAEIHEIRATGATPLERVMSLVQYGDYLSCHLARLNGVDPVPVDRITKLKNALG